MNTLPKAPTHEAAILVEPVLACGLDLGLSRPGLVSHLIQLIGEVLEIAQLTTATWVQRFAYGL